MTYPQQPGQPHGQQPGWRPGPPQGPGGSYPQHGQQFPQQGQYPQPGMGHQQPYPGPGQYGQQPPPMGGGMGGPGPQPPQKSKTGLIAGVVVAVVAVAAFAVTAFVAPGFLLSDDKDNGGGTATTNENSGDTGDSGEGGGDTGDDTGGDSGGDSGGGDSGGGGSDAATLADQVVQGFLEHDEDGLNQLACPGSESSISSYTEEAKFVKEFELQGEVEESGTTATVKARAALDNGEQQAEGVVTLTFSNESGEWCWKDMED